MSLTLVYGPPCGGKTTFVDTHRSDGDVVIDFDLLAVAFGSRSSHFHDDVFKACALVARDGVLARVRRGVNADVWLISTRSDAEDAFVSLAFDEVVLVDPGLDVCLLRAAGRPAGTVDLISDWYGV